MYLETFDQKSLRRIHKAAPSVALIQLFGSYATSAAIRAYLPAIPSYCVGIGPYKESIDHPLVAAANDHGLGVYAWTVNDAHEMDDLLALECRGVVTDFPDLLDDAISRHTALSPTGAIRR